MLIFVLFYFILEKRLQVCFRLPIFFDNLITLITPKIPVLVQLFFQNLDINRFGPAVKSRHCPGVVSPQHSLSLFLSSHRLFFIYSLSFFSLLFLFLSSQVSVPANFRNSPFSRSPENPAIYGTSHSEFLFHTSLRSLIAPQIADQLANRSRNHSGNGGGVLTNLGFLFCFRKLQVFCMQAMPCFFASN